MKASLIISVYKNTHFLKVVLDSLKYQSEKDFEIIISEDGNDADMKDFIAHYPFEQSYQHISQEDLGWRKNRCLNNSVRAAKADWLIFIDGDCVLHERFIEMHLHFARENAVLAGKRVKLDEASSKLLLENSANIQHMQKILKRKLLFGKGEIAFPEEGIFISRKSFFSFIPKLRKNNKLVGCNMSISKKTIYAVNGFDEDYVLPAVGEDSDLSWRLRAAGYHHVSLRNLAIAYHLNHPVGWENRDENLKKYREKINQNEFICKNGLLKL